MLRAILVIAIVSGCSEKKEGTTGESAAPKVEAKPAPPPPPPAAPKVPSTGVKACDDVAAYIARIEACAAVPQNIAKGLREMADNNLSPFKRDSMPDNYREYVGKKCAGTASYILENLRRYGCK